MKKLKLAFLNKYQGKVNRGAETFVKELSLRLSRKYQVDVISDINYWDLLTNKYDLIIIGGGPAGITAAIYAARKKIDFTYLDRGFKTTIP